jgi:hypothetical protein
MHNARLTAVSGGGSSEDGDQEAGSNPAKWTGSAEAYVREEVLDHTGSDGLDRLVKTEIILPGNLPVTVEPEDTLTYTPFGGEPVTRKAEAVIDQRLVGTLKVALYAG